MAGQGQGNAAIALAGSSSEREAASGQTIRASFLWISPGIRGGCGLLLDDGEVCGCEVARIVVGSADARDEGFHELLFRGQACVTKHGPDDLAGPRTHFLKAHDQRRRAESFVGGQFTGEMIVDKSPVTSPA